MDQMDSPLSHMATPLSLESSLWKLFEQSRTMHLLLQSEKQPFLFDGNCSLK